MAEKAFYFDNKYGKKLFGFYHIPKVETQLKRKKAILICHPIFEERVFAYLFLTNFARMACRNGYHVFRFDYFGYGDSEGDAPDATIESMLSDVEDAHNLFMYDNKLSDVSILGYRFGATIASLYGGKKKIKKLVLWDPIIDGNKFINQALRQTISYQTILFKRILATREKILSSIKENKPLIINGYNLASIDGYPLTKTLYEKVVAIKLMEIQVNAENIFLSYLIKPKRKISSNQKMLLKNFEQYTDVTSCIIEEAVLFWKDNITYKNSSSELFKNTLEWLKE